MHILVQPADDIPLYRQIVRQVQEALASARLRSGDQLPSQRELAQQVAVSPLTVKKAYDELEREGVIETRRGQGTFVVARPESIVDPAAGLSRLSPLLRRLLGEAWAAQVPLDAVINALRAESSRLDAERAAAAVNHNAGKRSTESQS
ncbi:MAG: GntR family transcriptional regulator [Planctomycetota bacterium]|jgi:GntR family transcriptional regulator